MRGREKAGTKSRPPCKKRGRGPPPIRVNFQTEEKYHQSPPKKKTNSAKGHWGSGEMGEPEKTATKGEVKIQTRGGTAFGEP